MVKAPKAFWNDPALALLLAEYYDQEALRSSRETGAALETLILHHLRVLANLMTPPARLYFWREHGGLEVDFTLEHGRRVLKIEVKLGAQVGHGDAAPLRRFLDECPQASGGVILYAGKTIRRLSDKILALPWPLLTGWVRPLRVTLCMRVKLPISGIGASFLLVISWSGQWGQAHSNSRFSGARREDTTGARPW